MKPSLLLNAIVLTLVIMTGCEAIYPFITDADTKSACDGDGDGLAASGPCGGNDCNDTDKKIGASRNWFIDVDQDGHGGESQKTACNEPVGFVDHNGDCDDTNENVHPDATEVCNDIDDNCDGEVDDQNIPVWYADADEDTYGNPDRSLTQCAEPDGYVDNALDCDDLEEDVNPEGIEICDDGIDQDCNGLIDDATESTTWYADTDGDTYGDPDNTFSTCSDSPSGYVRNALDCDDTDASTSPASPEACDDGIDNNCNGVVDTDAANVDWYRDADGDSYGDEAVTLFECSPPEGYVGNATDCDDTNVDVNPGVDEVCNNDIDDNCNASADQCVLTGPNSLSTADVFLLGESSNTYSGSPLVSCDVDGDGNGDVIVGAPYDSTGGTNTGSTFIFYNTSFTSVSSLTTSSADVALIGEVENDYAGSGLACGDVDNDGYDDILVGVIGDDEAGVDTGAVVLILGGGLSGDISLSQADAKWTSVDSSTGEAIVVSDINNDGYADIVVGSSNNDESGSNAGAVYLIYGSSAPSGTISLSTADATWTGEASGDRAGFTLASCDVDGDNNNDILISAPFRDDLASDDGAVYLIYGGSLSGTTSLTLADAKWTGEVAGDRTGTRIHCGGDVDNDGFEEILIASREHDETYSDDGAVYLIYGGSLSGSNNLTTADAKWTGEASGDMAGTSFAICDLDNDGADDILISSNKNDTAGSDAGAVYYFKGGSYSGTSLLTGADAIWTGVAGNDEAGTSIACLSDTSDFGTIIVGSPKNDDTSSNAGTTYLVPGLGY